MGYKALYRTYRPKHFEDVKGQDTIINTLKNIIANQKVSHAYLFCGPMGTGKTSVAKIFANALNCVHKQPNDLNACDNCIEHLEQSMDIVEMDAASNNGVDEIRDLREQIQTLPSYSKYKVYIIDEVHMLSKSAFNALLKTLEEPPAHVIFIFATTDPQKLPLTILSRLQRFNFKKISVKNIEMQLSYIMSQENISAQDNAIKLIARLAKGGMRDAISMLDQLAVYSNNHITLKDVYENFGITSVEVLVDILNLAHFQEVDKLLDLTQQLVNYGADINILVINLIDVIKDYIVYSKTKNEKLLEFVDLNIISLIRFNIEVAYKFLDILISLYKELKYSPIPYQILELNFLKMSSVNSVISNKNYQMISEYQKNEEQFSAQTINSVATSKDTVSTNIAAPTNIDVLDDKNQQISTHEQNNESTFVEQEEEIDIFDNSEPLPLEKHEEEKIDIFQDYLFDPREQMQQASQNSHSINNNINFEPFDPNMNDATEKVSSKDVVIDDTFYSFKESPKLDESHSQINNHFVETDQEEARPINSDLTDLFIGLEEMTRDIPTQEDIEAEKQILRTKDIQVTDETLLPFQLSNLHNVNKEATKIIDLNNEYLEDVHDITEEILSSTIDDQDFYNNNNFEVNNQIEENEFENDTVSFNFAINSTDNATVEESANNDDSIFAIDDQPVQEPEPIEVQTLPFIETQSTQEVLDKINIDATNTHSFVDNSLEAIIPTPNNINVDEIINLFYLVDTEEKNLNKKRWELREDIVYSSPEYAEYSSFIENVLLITSSYNWAILSSKEPSVLDELKIVYNKDNFVDLVGEITKKEKHIFIADENNLKLAMNKFKEMKANNVFYQPTPLPEKKVLSKSEKTERYLKNIFGDEDIEII